MRYLELFNKCLCGPWKTVGNDIQYKIVSNTIYFCPSNSDIDWKTNFNFPAIPYKNQAIKWYAHKGYVKAWKSARDIILKEMLYYNVITIVGYSFGAAIATLAHEDFMYTYPCNKVQTIVFGSPRVLWLPSKKILSRWNDLIRVKVSGDIVTNVPFSIFGFKHVGNKYLLGKYKFPWWTHHRPEEYIELLKEM